MSVPAPCGESGPQPPPGRVTWNFARPSLGSAGQIFPSTRPAADVLYFTCDLQQTVKRGDDTHEFCEAPSARVITRSGGLTVPLATPYRPVDDHVFLLMVSSTRLGVGWGTRLTGACLTDLYDHMQTHRAATLRPVYSSRALRQPRSWSFLALPVSYPCPFPYHPASSEAYTPSPSESLRCKADGPSFGKELRSGRTGRARTSGRGPGTPFICYGPAAAP